MKAIVQSAYGEPDVLSLAEIPAPVPGENDILVRVRAASVHAGDYFMMRGEPYVARFSAGWPRPKDYVPGYDVAGVVEAAGARVSGFEVGDRVFGECGGGACAEYACADAERFVSMPEVLTFEEAAAIPVSALAALQGLRDAAKVKSGQRVLIVGATGGVGVYALQIAKAMGAHVTGVCGPGNLELARSLGADHVIDYTREDFADGSRSYDVILDNIGNRTLAECTRALTPDGLLIPNSGRAGFGYFVMSFVRSLYDRHQGRPYLSMPTQADLLALREMLENGTLRPVIDRTYPLSETPEALRYIGAGHASGKVVITL